MPKIHINRKIKIGVSVIVVLLYALYVYVPFSVEIPDDLTFGYVDCFGERIELTQTEITAICEVLETASVRRLAFYDDRRSSYSTYDTFVLDIYRQDGMLYIVRAYLSPNPLAYSFLECYEGKFRNGAYQVYYKVYRVRNGDTMLTQILEAIGRAETNKT